MSLPELTTDCPISSQADANLSVVIATAARSRSPLSSDSNNPLALSSCGFCRALEDPPDSAAQTVLAESPAFVVWPSLGALIPGWTLILPKEHHLALAELSDEKLDELSSLHRLIQSKLTASGFGSTVSFEHGPAFPGQEVGCGVDHAHLHVVPTDANVLEGAAHLFPALRWRKVSSIASARSGFIAGESYLYVEDQFGRSWLAHHSDIPSQLIRQVIAFDLGRSDEFNWRAHPQLKNVERTVEIFSGP
jgi:ATP adenylyltransferase